MTIEQILEQVKSICAKENIREVILYGSWAKGTATERSDVDLALSGASDFERVKEKIDAIPTLRSFDVLNLDRCRNELLRKEVMKYGRKIL